MNAEAGQPFRIFGHRGDPRAARENTLESIERAIALGADGCECDVRRLADGTVVLFHDRFVDGSEAESLTLPALRERTGHLTTFDELLTVLGSPMESTDRSNEPPMLVVEMKRGGWEIEIARAAARYSNVVISSFDHRAVKALAELDPNLQLGLIVAGRLRDPARETEACGARWFFPAADYADQETALDCAQRGIRAVPWTVNLDSEWNRLRKAGFHGVITDVPGEALRWREGLQAYAKLGDTPDRARAGRRT